jgi:hypothetical protein
MKYDEMWWNISASDVKMFIFYVFDVTELKTINVSYLKDTEISYHVYTDIAVCWIV